MAPRRVIKPGIGVDRFELGMTRQELWALTDSTVRSAFVGSARDRTDTFLALALAAEYRDGVAQLFWVYVRMFDANRTAAPIVVLDDEVSAFTRSDVEALLTLHRLAAVDDVEQIQVPSLGLTFGFREDFGQPPRLEFLLVGAPEPAG